MHIASARRPAPRLGAERGLSSTGGTGRSVTLLRTETIAFVGGQPRMVELLGALEPLGPPGARTGARF